MKTKRKQNVKHIPHFFHILLLWFTHTEKLWKQYETPAGLTKETLTEILYYDIDVVNTM